VKGREMKGEKVQGLGGGGNGSGNYARRESGIGGRTEGLRVQPKTTIGNPQPWLLFNSPSYGPWTGNAMCTYRINK
jgi:hypothetical protein